MPTRMFTTPRWRRLVRAAFEPSPALLAATVALLSAAYLIGSGHDDPLLLAWLSTVS